MVDGLKRRSRGVWPAIAAILVAAGITAGAWFGRRPQAQDRASLDRPVTPSQSHDQVQSLEPARYTDTTLAEASPTPQSKATPRAKPAAQKSTDQVKISADEIAANRTFGSKLAPITIDEYSDYQCPACRQLFLQTIRPMLDDYVASGKVYFVFHDFPLPGHQYSKEAAHYADAAAAIGKFEQVAETLFNKQAEWSTKGNLEQVVASSLAPAEMKRLQSLLHDSHVDEVIDRDVSTGNQLSVRQTPTMFINRNGQRTPVAGVVSYQLLKMYLDNLMK